MMVIWIKEAHSSICKCNSESRIVILIMGITFKTKYQQKMHGYCFQKNVIRSKWELLIILVKL